MVSTYHRGLMKENIIGDVEGVHVGAREPPEHAGTPPEKRHHRHCQWCLSAIAALHPLAPHCLQCCHRLPELTMPPQAPRAHVFHVFFPLITSIKISSASNQQPCAPIQSENQEAFRLPHARRKILLTE